MGEIMPWSAVVICVVVVIQVVSDKGKLENLYQKTLEENTKLEAVNSNLQQSVITCTAELKGYSNGSK